MRTRKRRSVPQPMSMFETVVNMFQKMDTDRDRVPDWRDCQPLNPKKHGTGYIYDEAGNIIKKGDLKDISKEYFGLTDDPREAGYILPSGEMLDFSGKRFGAMGGDRQMDHRQIQEVMKESQSEAMIKFQKEEGAIRMSKFKDGDLNIDAVVKPTSKQVSAISKSLQLPTPFMLLERTNEKGFVTDPVKHRLESERPHPVLIQKWLSRAFEEL